MFSFFSKKELKDSVKEIQEVEDYTNISLVAEYFKGETGVTFDKQTSILQNKVTTFCKQRSIASFQKLLEVIKYDRQIKQELIDTLTTNETFFYREFKQIDELVSLVKQRGGSFTEILCAPCATGEEPYTIAIALLEAGVSQSSFRIVGIDINQDAINKAAEAIYRERNVRNLSPQVIDRYFSIDKESYILRDSIKSLVSLKVVNIFDSNFKSIGKFDFVFSRNMLIYFDKETKLKAKKILEDLRKDTTTEVFFGHADLF